MKLNEEKLMHRYEGLITGSQDLTGGEPPSALFPLLSRLLFRSMSNDPEIAVREKDVKRRRRIHGAVIALAKHFLTCPQVYLRRSDLEPCEKGETYERSAFSLPGEPAVYIGNHAFKDDGLATILAAGAHTYPVIGSLPQLHNAADGAFALANGLILVNRKIAESRRATVDKAVRAIGFGAGIVIMPEGVLNKTPNALLLDYWSGAVRIARQTGAPIVPIVHYVRDCNGKGKTNPIYTVIDEPVRVDGMETGEATELLRERIGTIFYRLMEKYGVSTRRELVGEYETSAEAWEESLRGRVKTLDRYDFEIETTAHYRPRDKVTPASVWLAVADIEHITPQNASHVAFANNIVRECRINDYQSRF